MTATSHGCRWIGGNDVTTLWTYVTAAARGASGAGAVALATLESPQPQVDEALASLLNDLSCYWVAA